MNRTDAEPVLIRLPDLGGFIGCYIVVIPREQVPTRISKEG